MAGDVNKHLERAKRFLEKNRVADAIQAYLAVLDEAPQHQEATQALGDLHARIDADELAGHMAGLRHCQETDELRDIIGRRRRLQR